MRRRLIVFLMGAVAVAGTLVGVVCLVLTIGVLQDPARDSSRAAVYGYLGTFVGIPGFLLLFVQTFLALRGRLRPDDPLAQLRRGVRKDLESRLRVMRSGDGDIDLRYAPEGRGRGVDLDEAAAVARFSSRVVFLGEGGSGKSYSALRAALSILRENDDRVPVVVPLSRWDAQGDWPSWLCGFLADEFNISRETVQDLLEDGRFVPILDGLDEARLAGTASTADDLLQAIIRWRVLDRPAPFILTCRSEFWSRLAVRTTGDRSLDVFAVRRVGVPEAKMFASQVLSATSPTAGEELVELLRAANLSDVVQSPWGLAMACSVARKKGLPAAVQAGVDHTLVREFVWATASRAATNAIKRVTLSLDLWWLAAYSRYLKSNETTRAEIDGVFLDARDLELHLLWPAAGRLAPRIVDLAMATLLSAPGLVWAVAFLWNRGPLVRTGLVVFVVLWLALMRRTTLKAWVPAATQDLSRLRQPRFILRQTGFALVAALVTATVFAPAVAVLVFLTAWFAIGLTVGFGQTLATDSEARVVGPTRILRRERRISRSAAWTLAPLLSVAFAQTWGWATGVIFAVTYCLVVGETVGCALWRRYLAMIIASRLRLSPTPERTLERLHRIGLVRVAGLAYQLRHEDLLEHFAVRDDGPLALLRQED